MRSLLLSLMIIGLLFVSAAPALADDAHNRRMRRQQPPPT